MILLDLAITGKKICPAKMADSETDLVPNAFRLFLGAKELYVHLLKIIFINYYHYIITITIIIIIIIIIVLMIIYRLIDS